MIKENKFLLSLFCSILYSPFILHIQTKESRKKLLYKEVIFIEKLISIVSVLAALSSIVFAYLTFLKSKKEEMKLQGKNEGIILSDIAYIKESVSRMERNFLNVEKRYEELLKRVLLIEEKLEMKKN